MRHFLALALLPGRMGEATVAAGLILSTRLPQRLPARPLAAAIGAVAIPAVTPRADEKRLPAFSSTADDESK